MRANVLLFRSDELPYFVNLNALTVLATLRAARLNIVDSRFSIVRLGGFDLGVHVNGPVESQDMVAALGNALARPLALPSQPRQKNPCLKASITDERAEWSYMKEVLASSDPARML